MFTGIVQACLPIAVLERQPSRVRLGFEFSDQLRTGIRIGASVAVDGICLTVAAIEGSIVSFDAVQGTIDRTNIAARDQGNRVNIERSLVMGAENGGHHVSGHVTDVAIVVGADTVSSVNYLDFTVPEEWRKYIFPRGFIALNGASLTVAETDEDMGLYRVNLIPETIRQTSFSAYRPGDRMNFEIDSQTQIMVDTIERCFRQQRRW